MRYRCTAHLINGFGLPHIASTGLSNRSVRTGHRYKCKSKWSAFANVCREPLLLTLTQPLFANRCHCDALILQLLPNKCWMCKSWPGQNESNVYSRAEAKRSIRFTSIRTRAGLPSNTPRSVWYAYVFESTEHVTRLAPLWRMWAYYAIFFGADSLFFSAWLAWILPRI